MKYETISLRLLENKKEYALFLLLLLIVYMANMGYLYMKYEGFIGEELIKTSGQVLNIYPKPSYNVIKIHNEDMIFFTTILKDSKISKMDYIDLVITSKGIDFLSYLKGFYTQSFSVRLRVKDTFKNRLFQDVLAQQTNKQVAELFNAIFFAVPLGVEIRDFCAVFGISHLIAISGFHLGIIVFVSYWCLYLPYSFLHGKYFPYRNKKFDVFMVCSIVLCIYLVFTNVVPSLLRAFVMFIFGLYLLRRNIKLLSYETLCIITLLIIAFFPKYLFSLSLWFSLIAVFYIFLFLQYFKTIPKLGQFILFNMWIFLVMNPISHFYFEITSYWQLISPFLTVGFTVFYPLEFVLHLFGQGALLDIFIEYLMDLKSNVYLIRTPAVFFYFYLLYRFFQFGIKKYLYY